MFKIGDLVKSKIHRSHINLNVGDFVVVTEDEDDKGYFSFKIKSTQYQSLTSDFEYIAAAGAHIPIVPFTSRNYFGAPVPFSIGDMVEAKVDSPSLAHITKKGDIVEVTKFIASGFEYKHPADLNLFYYGEFNEFTLAVSAPLKFVGLAASLGISTGLPPCSQGVDPVYTPANVSSQFVPLNCECGSEKVGSPRHSAWCPKYDKES